MTRPVNAAGVSLIKEFEAKRLRAYLCQAGVPSIAWGHTRTVSARDVKSGKTITEAEAERLLREDLTEAARSVERRVTVALNDNQFAALVSFVFNVGALAFGGSTLLKRINAGKFADVRAQLARWNKIRLDDGSYEVSAGLTRRRAAEADLFERAA
jgi:GH24 family phage-related lysozyme (muramidase)